MITMGKHLPFINLYTHAKLDWEMSKRERWAANPSTDEEKNIWEQEAKIIKGKLQTFKMNEAFFESLR